MFNFVYPVYPVFIVYAINSGVASLTLMPGHRYFTHNVTRRNYMSRRWAHFHEGPKNHAHTV